MRSIKVLQLGKFYYPDTGGIETTMQDIVQGLNNTNFQNLDSQTHFICDVLCASSSKKFQFDILDNARVLRAKSFGKLARTAIAPQMIFTLKKIINAYDVIHIHFPDPMANLALLLANNEEKIIVLHYHSDVVKQKFLLKFYAPLQNWLLRRANVIIGTTPAYIASSPFLKDFQNKCVAIPSGVRDMSVIASLDSENLNSEIRQKFNLKDKKILFALGRLVEYKGFKYAIESMQFLSDDFVLCIGGKGELEKQLKSICKKLGLENKVRFVGFLSDEQIAQFYKLAHAFVFSSITKNEAFGLVQAEAMSCSTPIVCCDIAQSGVSWVNQNGFSGIVVPIKDPKAIAQAVLEISQNRDFYSRNARMRFEQFFTKDKMLSSIKKLYIELIGGGGITT